MAIAIVTAIGLVVLVEPQLAAVLRSRGRRVGACFAAACSIVLAVIGTLSGLSPLGDGRTDEVLYPSLVVLLVAAATQLAQRATASRRLRDAVVVATTVVLAVGAVVFGAFHVGEYPPTGLAEVLAGVRAEMLPGDVVVIDGYESFTFADDDLGPWKVSFAQGQVPWPMGFHVQSLDPTYVLSTNYLQPDTAIDRLLRTTRRVWFVGPTLGGYSTAAPSGIWSAAYCTPTLHTLNELGFGGSNEFVSAQGVFAQLLVYQPPKARVPPLCI